MNEKIKFIGNLFFADYKSILSNGLKLKHFSEEEQLVWFHTGAIHYHYFSKNGLLKFFTQYDPYGNILEHIVYI
jgi:hypothetical protein